MGRKFPTPRDDSDERVLENVRRHGCHIIHVGADDKGPGWSYSIGLFHSFAQPEVMLFGLPWSTAEGIINGLSARMNAKQSFAHGDSDSEVLESHNVKFVSVSRDHYRAHLGYAIWFYGGVDFPTLQVVWPDNHGGFPWDPDCALDDRIQPILGNRKG